VADGLAVDIISLFKRIKWIVKVKNRENLRCILSILFFAIFTNTYFITYGEKKNELTDKYKSG